MSGHGGGKACVNSARDVTANINLLTANQQAATKLHCHTGLHSTDELFF